MVFDIHNICHHKLPFNVISSSFSGTLCSFEQVINCHIKSLPYKMSIPCFHPFQLSYLLLILVLEPIGHWPDRICKLSLSQTKAFPQLHLPTYHESSFCWSVLTNRALTCKSLYLSLTLARTRVRMFLLSHALHHWLALDSSLNCSREMTSALFVTHGGSLAHSLEWPGSCD